MIQKTLSTPTGAYREGLSPEGPETATRSVRRMLIERTELQELPRAIPEIWTASDSKILSS